MFKMLSLNICQKPALLSFCFYLFSFCFSHAQLTKYVNPFIGTGGTGHTFPGATTPFAMVQLSPDTRIDGSWEGCSGYHYDDSIIYGFSHTHLSGTGCSDYGDIAFMPWFSTTNDFEKLKTKELFSSKFSHKKERASAGYYSVDLEDIPVKVDLTATTRTGFQRYTFNEDGYGYIVLNLKHRDELLEGKIEKSGTNIYKGIRVSKEWAKRQELYYGFEILAPTPKGELMQEFIAKENGSDTKLILQYKITKGQQILIKTGISTVDGDAALNNLKVENPNWDFEKTKLQAQQSWEKELRKIEVQDAKLSNKTKELVDKLTTFYTAMYHCMIHPSIMNDVDGRYKGRDGKIHKAEGFNYYTVFSLWDTHRALHPLLNIIDKKRSHDFVITFLKQYEQGGMLPMWELWNNETYCMIGFHSVSVILDAYRKQVINKNELQQLWPAVKAAAMADTFGLKQFREKGYLSVEDENESVSKTLEYSYDMWSVSEIASELDLKKDEQYFRKYVFARDELMNQKTGFIQPRKNGNWLEPFDPFEVNNNYTEANAWQYSFYNPQFYMLRENFKMLDSLFVTNNKINGRQQVDITGMIGQYAHGNEPSHSYIYQLGNEKKAKYLKYVYENFYTNKPDGLIGNEDCGQMSAWYVMSALGFYQVCPGRNLLSIGYPLFKNYKITIDSIHAFLFDSATLSNGYRYTRLIDEKAINKFNKEDKEGKWGSRKIKPTDTTLHYYSDTIHNYYFDSLSSAMNQCKSRVVFIHNTAPLIIPSSTKPFFDSCLIELIGTGIENLKGYRYYYSINNSKYLKYSNPFCIKNSATIKAFAIYPQNDNDSLELPYKSNPSIAHFYKRPNNYSIQLNCKYHRFYTADGDDGIIDGQYADKDFRKGGWQGYQSQDFEAIVDMKEKKEFAEISANFLQDTRSWIVFPTKVEFYISDDNINYKLVQTDSNYIPAKDYNLQTQKFTAAYTNRSINILPPNQKRDVFRSARYIKVKAYNYGKFPEWHLGRGGDAFIFIDEIEIK